MAKKNNNYMALEDFQTLWDDKLKPAIAMKEELDDYYNKTQTDNLLGDKQDTLVSGTNIKTINNQSLVGDGNITITGASVEPSTTTPLMDGTASVGTENAYARGDHRHPSDTTKVDKVSGKGLSTNDYTTDEKNKLSGIASGAEVNQNAFSNVGVKVGNTTTTVAADAKTDTVTLIQGSNVTLTTDTTNDTITIAATDTTYSAATTSAAGLMSSDDKTKLNGIASGATNVTTSTVAGWGYTKNAGTVTQVKVGSTAYDPSSGVVSLPAYPTSLPASDVYSWAKASSKPSYTASEVGLGNVGNFKAVSTVASQGLSSTEQSNARANIGAGTSSFSGSYNDLSNKPTIPAAANNGTYTVKTLVGSTTTNVSDFTANQSGTDDVTFVQGSNVTITPDATNRKITIAAKDTTYSAATTSAAGLMSSDDKTKLNGIASGATAVSSSTVSGWGFTKNTGTVTQVKIGSTAYKPSSGVISLPAYPTDTNTHRPIQVNGTEVLGNNTTALNLKAGTNVSITNSSGTVTITSTDTNTWRPVGTGASDAAAGNHTHGITLASDSGTSSVSLAANTKYKLTAGGQSIIFTTPADNNTTYSSKSAASGGTDVSLVTTGEKYTWNHKSNFSGNYNDLSNKPTIPSVSQSTGTSTTDVMSQKAVSDELDGKLSLSGGTMTGMLKAAKGIYGNSSDGLLVLRPDDGWAGISNTQWGVGAIAYQGVIRSNNSNLIHYKYPDGNSVILDASNYDSYALPLTGGTVSGNVHIGNISSSCKLAVGGSIDLSGDIYLGNNSRIRQPEKNDNFLYIGTAGNYGWVRLQDICSQNGTAGDSSGWSIRSDGKAKFVSVAQTSDIRKKDIIENINLDIKDIACAPIFKFTWLDPEMPEGINVGTSAQYWQTILPNVVFEMDDKRTLSMQYGVAGLVSSVALAKKVVEQEETIKAQEARIKALEDAIANIQNMLNK